ncbi:rhoptry-associated protein 1 [Babesia caballi]|uniref:Rhoptry-associated protein 1 n=3 Tax=Babesia caballi TaxID=5871 RepID=A0AAV4LS84_BABCB|nr:rhoptry-associated protein 1 [Babesia caballi]
MRCSASSLFGALLLVARGALAVRHNSRVSIMAPSDSVGDVTKTLLAASESVDSAANAYMINSDMSDYLSAVSDNFAERICSQVPKGSNCSASVSAYMSRCAKQDCLTLQSLKYPLEAKYQPLTLPDPYQLEAAFILFKESGANPANSAEKRFWMRFKRGKNHSYFHDFVFNLLEKNVTRDAYATDIENFASKYLYMTTVYYKTYTNVDGFGASFFDKLSFTTGLFGWGIRRALKQIIRSNLPLDIGTEHSVSRLQHITSSYKDYMATQIPALPKFAKRFSRMVVRRLLATVAGYVDAPWYKKWYMKLKNFMVNRVFLPTKNFFNNKVAKPLRKHRKGNVSDSGESEEISAVGESLESDNEMKTQESMNSESASTELPSDESEEESAAMVIQQPTLEEASQIALPAEEDSSELQETSDNYEASL